MSLINDALKRAKQAQELNPPPPPNLPFRAAEPAPQRKSPLPMILLFAVAAVFLVGGLLVVMALEKRASAPQVVTATQLPDPAQPTAVVEASPLPDPLPDATLDPTIATPETPAVALLAADADSLAITEAVTEVALATPTADESVVAPLIETPSAPALKLQGIFYNPNRPSAIVNGKTVFVGNSVGELRVLAITREAVTLGSTTQTNVLALDD
ncbi:MAG: hypothetical protein IH623_19040 [Verrucomicrobia bacterium]|nr:hypothetical protein [Verrucomicrobiota bacterium]